MEELETMENLASKTENLTLAWSKAHVGIEGNEQSDKATKEGASGGAHLRQAQEALP